MSLSHTDELKVEGRLPLRPGRRFRATGHRGWLRFYRATSNDRGDTWIDAWDRQQRMRSIDPRRVTRVERRTS